MSREATDQLYIELGYYYPEEYYTYQAEAAAAIAFSATVSCDAVRLGAPIEASASLASTTTSSSTVSVTKQTDVGLVSQTVISTTAGKIVSVSADFQGAFTPSMTVIAYKNHTAALQSITVIDITAVANRSSSVTLANIANLDAQAAKTATVDSAMAMTAVITAEANTFKQSAQADLNTQSTVAANAGKLKITGSSLASTFTIPPTTRYFGSGRPRNLSGGTTSTAQKKFGSYSLSGSDLAQANNQVNVVPNQSEDFAFEGWVYGGSGLSGTILSYLDITNSRNAFIRLSLDASGVLTFTRYVGTTASATTYTHTSALTAAWHHILIAKDTGRISLFIDGTRAYTSTSVGASIWTGYGSTNCQISITPRNRYLDEFSLHFGTTLGFDPSASTITVPTTGRLNDPATTVFLYHFENNLLDDISVLAEAAANIAADSAISATAQPLTKSAVASLQSTTAVSATATKIVVDSAAVSIDTAATVTADRYRTTASNQSSELAQSAVVGVIKQFAVVIDTAFTPSITVSPRLAGVALLENNTEITATAVKTAVVDSSMLSDTAVSAQITAFVGVDSAQLVTTEISATIGSVKQFAADLAVNTTTTVVIDRIVDITSDLSSDTAASIDVDRYRLTLAALAAETTQTADNQRTRSFEITAQSTTTVAATVTRIQTVEATLSSQSAITALAVKTTYTAIDLAAVSETSTQAVKTALGQVDILTAFTPTVTANFTLRPPVYLESRATLTAVIGAIKQFEPLVAGTQTPDRIATIVNENYLGDVFVAHLWVRRHSVDASAQAPIWSTPTIYASGGSPGTQGLRLEYDATSNIRLVRLYNGQPYVWTWTSAYPSDTDWHNFIVVYRARTQGPVYVSDSYELFVDGTSLGIQTIVVPSGDHATGFYTGEDVLLPGLYLGQTVYGSGETNKGTTSTTGLDIAQVWIGVVNKFNALDYYDQGIKNLGPDGTDYGQLDTPWIYSLRSLTQGTASSQPIALPLLVSQSAITVRFIGVFLYQAFLTASTALSATVVRQQQTSAALDLDSAMSATATKQTGTVQTLVSDSELEAVIGKITEFDLALASQSEVSAVVGLQNELLPTTLTATSTFTADVTIIEPIRTSAEIAATTAVTADVYRIKQFDSEMAVNATVSASAAVIPPIRTEAALESTTQLTATVNRTRDFANLNQSSGTLTIEAVKTARLTDELQATTEITVDPQNIIGIVADLTVQSFKVTVADVINITPFLTLTITEETRTIKIYQETRTLTVDQESRILTLGGY